MWWRARQSKDERAAPWARATIAFVAVFLAYGLMGNAAEACPDSSQTANSAITHRIERISPVATAVVSAAPERTAIEFNQRGRCCSAGCHTHGAACGSGCCAAGFAAGGLVYSNLFSPMNSAGLSPFDQAVAVSARPPPDLRPPRILI